MKGVTITKLPQINDSKGTTVEWCKGENGQQVTIYERAKGIFFAQHYHEGTDPSKKPEIFVLLKGKIEFIFIDPETNEKHKKVVEPYDEVRIEPHIKHSAHALEDSLFLEYRSTPFDKDEPDTIPVSPDLFTD